ncbi:hypothetical protein XANCAGTX0491_006408 [Xanthoria calcicola]
MVVCKFYLEDRCRFGTHCKNEHPPKYNRNPFAPLQNNNRSHPSGQSLFDRGSNTPELPFKLDKTAINTDLGSDRPLYILSAYGPGKDAPQQLFGGQPREQSFEELRLRHYELASAGNEAQAIQEAQALYSNAEQQIKTALDDLDGAIKYITDAANQHPNRLDICQAKGGNISPVQPPPPDPRSTSGAFTRGPAFGQPSFGQPALPVPASAFGQPSFGQPSAPAPGSAFGKPSFGQAAAPGAAFGQPSNLGQQSMTSAQPSNLAPATAFGQSSTPSLFRQPQQTAKPSGLQQPAFGQAGSHFGQQSSTGPQASSAFGQQPTVATSNPFANVSKPPFAHDQSTTASASAFGSSALPQPSRMFGQSSTTSQATANPFGSKNFGAISGTLGQSVPTPAPATTGMFGKPSAPPTSTGFAPQSIPVVNEGPSNNAPHLITSRSGAPASATFGPGRVGDRKLLTWQGHKVEYVDDEPCVKPAGDGGWRRVWFPEGPPTFTSKTREYPDGYQLDEAAKENFKHFLQHGIGSDGLIPNMPPPRDMLSWDF